MDTLTEIRERADAIRRHLLALDAEEARLRARLKVIADERREGRLLLAMAGVELGSGTHTTRGM